MIGLQRGKTGGQCGAAPVAELVGMQLDGQTEFAGACEDAADLRRIEGVTGTNVMDLMLGLKLGGGG